MVGNDIIDIAKAKKESNWQRPRFLDKLFTIKEQQLIRYSDNSFIMVWRLWSMKEAAYKLYTQLKPSRFYNPKGFECKIEGKHSLVRFKDFECFVETKITSDYIVSEARLDTIPMTSKVIKFKNYEPVLQSIAIRNQTLKFITKHLSKPSDKIRITSSVFNIPRVKINSKLIPISLTHHGNYGAFVIA
ncbi:hypothetical protein BTO05_09005 [Winogradskyella sp. PC-19]|uniref:4'-phosphopantetheinyl transferase family protein n=1 Tax=unclassified Winogradskyella TaxID=2615021 RepID=UPI000B3C2970|nr:MULTISPECIES: 4'-phosphopantetheinyl transferase superfamily protein [unclassified Winogradskyella]ARV09774.1 hypothetical protein BTO05_09005 [Winogradskyella sp. PC-19]RZN76043.1 MAG: 4-phosphopantetheinyl transferase family protein [Winogradskyella sp.]